MSVQQVQYILLAEFDIDKGAIIKHQYPNETGIDEHILSELMLPDGAHLRTEDWTIFCLNQSIPDIEQVDSVLYVLNLVRTKHDASAKRGARVKAMAICTEHQYLHIYKPVLLLAMEKYYQNPEIETLETLYKAVNSMDVSKMPQLSWHEKQILRASDNKTIFEEMFMENVVVEPNLSRRGTFIDLASGNHGKKIPAIISKDTHFFEVTIHYDGINLPVKVPLTVNPEEVGDFSVIQLINTFSQHPCSPNPHHPHLDSTGSFTHPILLLLYALLTQKRIIFLGHGYPSGVVANYVLAACAIGSGCGTVLKGFTKRAFPYTNLTSVDDLLKCPGFIAGVTNPTYKEHTGWWDVLCDISTGRITVNDRIEAKISHETPRVTQQCDHDIEFMNDVLTCIQSHYGETLVRAKFQEYVYRFVQLSAVYEEQVYGQTSLYWQSEILGSGPVFTDKTSKKKEINANINRIEGWRQTMSYKYYQRDLEGWLENSSIKQMDVYRQISKLKKLKNMPDNEVISIYEAFLSHIITHQQIIQFLSYLPQHQGGLSIISIGLFHSNPQIRTLTVNLLKRIQNNPIGIKFIQDLSRFHRIAYERQQESL